MYFLSIGVRCKRNLLSDHKGSKSACRLAEKGRCCDEIINFGFLIVDGLSRDKT